MINFTCPKCGGTLDIDLTTAHCQLGHNYDIAKSGYINLLLSQRAGSKNHGDDKLMVRSRRDFLNAGYYAALRDALCDAVRRLAFDGIRILDAGCGECYYTSAVAESLRSFNPEIAGIDISKDALVYGAKRGNNISLAVASVYKLPVADNSCDLILSVFSPYDEAEFRRALVPNGIVIYVYPLERHLFSLKAAAYDEPYLNTVEAPKGERICVRDNIHLKTQADIMNLFTMTPYYYKSGEKEQARLSRLAELDVEIEFGIETIRL